MVGLAFMQGAAVALTAGAAALDDVASTDVLQTNQRFGEVVPHHWAGTIDTDDGPREFELILLEARYSSYDVERTIHLPHITQYGNQSVTVGVFASENVRVALAGRRSGYFHSVVDVDLLADPEILAGPWLDYVQSVEEANADGGTTAPDQVMVSFTGPDRRRVALALAPEHAALLGKSPIGRALHDADADASLQLSSSLGELTSLNGDVYDLRWQSLRVGADSPLEVGILTWSRTRVLEAPVPPGSYWPTRAAFVRTLHALERAGVGWMVGEYPERAREIVAAHIGIRLSQGEFLRQVEDTFGSIEAAVSACCEIPPLMHFALVRTNDHFNGSHWIEEREPGVKRENQILLRLQLDGSSDDKDSGSLLIGYPQSPEQAPPLDIWLRRLEQ